MADDLAILADSGPVPGQNEPEVSVILPSYNVTKYIGQALDSVLAQTFRNFEVIVVNDGCPDTAALEQALEPYRSRIRYVRKKNGGAASARNTAIRLARAPLIFQLDPDDWLEPHCLEQQVRFLREHPEFDAAYCNSFNLAESPEAALQWGPLNNTLHMNVFPSNGPVTFSGVLDCRTCPRNPGSILRREMLLRIGLYDETFRCEEDLDLWLRILKADPPGAVGYTHEPLVHYRLRTNSLTMDSIHGQALVDVLEKAARVLRLTAEERASLDRRLQSNRLIVAAAEGRRAVREGRWKDAIRHFEFCQQVRPATKTRVALMLLRTAPWMVPAGMNAWDRYLDRRKRSMDIRA